jgi:hypothetical protein
MSDYEMSSFVKYLFDATGRHRIINDRLDKEPYLERYYLFLKDRGNFPFNIFVHKFLKSDPDELHDHPWSYFTFMLKGGYWEHTIHGKKWCGPFSYRYNAANTLHRIELDKDVKECWTLFIPGRKKREWGFETDTGWVNNEEYLVSKKES